jgi:hypothetical protein
MRLLLALLGVALVAAGPSYHPIVDTRADCPPEGFTALSSHARLDRLPAGGKYAICQTGAQALAAGPDDAILKFTVSNGVFRLRDSVLIVDNKVQIEFLYPARPDWHEVVVNEFESDTDATWRGISIRGAPPADQLTNHYNHWPAPFGNCGDIDTVLVAGVDNRLPSWSFDTCYSSTKINKPTVFDGRVGMSIVDSKEIVIVEAHIAGTEPVVDFDSDSIFADTEGYTAVVTARSQIGFINPSLYVFNDGIQVTDGSSVTVCDPFIKSIGGGDGIQVGAGDDSHPSIVAVAGVSNLFFPEDVSFQNNGILYTLYHCPSVMKPSYNMKEWKHWYTANTV